MDRLSDYDYHLPPELIAQVPLDDRGASRLLTLNKTTGEVQHRSFQDVPELLLPGDVLVLNNTKVSALRLIGKRPTGGAAELFLMERTAPGQYRCLAKPGRKLGIGAIVQLENGLSCQVVEMLPKGERVVQFDPHPNLTEALNDIGETPLPPYIHTALPDSNRYQTIYAQAEGSSAAPTAGLHFTDSILAELRAKGVELATVTLSVGFDTFRPVESEELDEHVMHGEVCSITEEAADIINGAKGRIIAVGTTSVRTLESFAVGKKRVEPGTKRTQIFIRPGTEFQIIDGMFTNFHLPRTTMLMMISALASRESIFSAYSEAIREQYRFLSFGDSMLIF